MSRSDVDIVVIGGGAGGLTAAGVAAAFGARTALVERARTGGDCTWTACIPSKTLLAVAKETARARELAARGVAVGDIRVDFGSVMAHVRRTRERVYREADAPDVLARHGIQVLEGTARFQDEHTLAIRHGEAERTLTFRSAILATGATAVLPPVPGLDDADCFTHETLFDLTEQPRDLLVLGAGPAGVEMAQAFQLLGTRVTIVATSPRILPRDDEACSSILHRRLMADGVDFRLGETLHHLRREDGRIQAEIGPPDRVARSVTADAVLIAIGRQPNLIDLELEKTGVALGREGLSVDAHCRTSRPHVFAVGDVASPFQFTHVAEAMGRTAALNAVLRMPLFRWPRTAIPWVTFTDPECARVGASREELERAGTAFDVIDFPYSRIDRAVTEGEDKGKILVFRRGESVLGASVAGPRAGEIIGTFALAMRNRIPLARISGTLYPYPTMLLGARRAADQALIRRHRPWMSRLVRWIYRYRGEIPATVGSGEVI